MEYPKYLNDGKSFIKVLNPSQMVTVIIGEKIEGMQQTATGINVFTINSANDRFDASGCKESTRQEFEKAFGEAMYQFAKTGAMV